MKLKVHVAADQLTQWWDQYACRKSKKARAIIDGTRYYQAMIFLETEGFLVHKYEARDDIVSSVTWELPTAAPLNWRSLDKFRLVERDPMAINDEEFKTYVGTLINGWSRKSWEKCINDISEVLELIADGYAESIRWTDEGRLEFKATPLGVERGLDDSEVYESVVGQGMSTPILVHENAIAHRTPYQ
jgi:hypothetical protein